MPGIMENPKMKESWSGPARGTETHTLNNGHKMGTEGGKQERPHHHSPAVPCHFSAVESDSGRPDPTDWGCPIPVESPEKPWVSRALSRQPGGRQSPAAWRSCSSLSSLHSGPSPGPCLLPGLASTVKVPTSTSSPGFPPLGG